MPVYEDNGSSETYALIEEHEVLVLEVIEVSEDTSFYKNDDGTDKKNVVFKFRVMEGEHNDRLLWGRTPTTWSSSDKCKLRQWAEQILNRKIAAGEALNTDDLVGRRCRGVVGVSNKQDGTQSNKITDVMKDKSAPAMASSYDEPF
jgi:hypothetical protein